MKVIWKGPVEGFKEFFACFRFSYSLFERLSVGNRRSLSFKHLPEDCGEFFDRKIEEFKIWFSDEESAEHLVLFDSLANHTCILRNVPVNGDEAEDPCCHIATEILSECECPFLNDHPTQVDQLNSRHRDLRSKDAL